MKKGIIYVIITAVLFATFEPASKVIAGDIVPYALTFWRFLIGSLMLMPFAIVKIKKEKIKLKGTDLLRMTLLGILFICISMVLLQVGIKQATNPSLMAIIFSSNSVFTIVFSVLLMKEKLSRNKIIALASGVIGVLLCADFTSGTNLVSVLLAFLSALTFSLYTVLNQKFRSKAGGIIQTAGAFFLGSIVLLIALLVGKVQIIPTLDATGMWIMVFVSFLVTGVGYMSYFRAIDQGGVIMASLAFFIKPILTPFCTWAINGIAPDFKVFVAILFIIIASYFATYKKEN